MAVKKAKNQLLDPRFMLQWLRKLMQPIIAENISSSVGVQDAFQALESYLTRYANPVQKKQSAKHLPDSISLTGMVFKEVLHVELITFVDVLETAWGMP